MADNFDKNYSPEELSYDTLSDVSGGKAGFDRPIPMPGAPCRECGMPTGTNPAIYTDKGKGKCPKCGRYIQ